MADTNVQTSHPPTAPEPRNKPTTQPKATLQDVLDTLHESDFFPQTGKDATSRFWSAYERVAKQHDDEFIERHNGDMDVLLIFAGLFSAVSSAFIVNMQSILSPNASDTTNALLKILVNKIDNTTFPIQEAALPVWNGPSSTTIWIQSLAYTSLSSSLLAAFGAVLGKQWLGHFKTSRFRRGALHERCQRRQQKLDGLEAWHFGTILATLPIFLLLSLLFFAIALAANMWTQQHTVAGVIMATTAFGLIFYFFTVVSSLKSPDCPFQTPVSTVLQHVLRHTAAFRMVVQRKWGELPTTWAGFLNGLSESSRHVFHTAKDLIIKLITYCVACLLKIPSALRHTVRSLANDPEAAGVSPQSGRVDGLGHSPPEAAGEQTASPKELDLSSLESHDSAPIYAVQSSAVQWILETSTDTEITAAAARMVPEIEWPANHDVTGVLDRLRSHLYACFDPTRQIIPLTQTRAAACLKAICHVCVERDRDNTFYIYTDGAIYSPDNASIYHMLPDEAFLVVHCAVGEPETLDLTSLPLSDRLWMAHIFTYRLHKGDCRPEFVAFVIDFIGVCLDSKSPARLVADCLLLAGMLIGMQTDRRHLAKLDKSKALVELRDSVMDRMLRVLVRDIPSLIWHQNALKLIHSLLQDMDKHMGYFDLRSSKRALKLCFHLLEQHPGTTGEDQVRSNSVAILIRSLTFDPFWDPRRLLPCTPAQFDLLVDFHLQICEGTDSDLIRDSFWLLEWLGGSPSTPNRMRRYIEMTIRFMGYPAALHAALAIQSVVASMGRDDESLREDFSKALAFAVLSDATQEPPLGRNPFKDISFFSRFQHFPYLKCLSILSQEPTWQPQLHQNGHFDNCLAIADTLLSQRDDDIGLYVVLAAQILAAIDAAGEEHPFFRTVQTFPSWLLIMRAWRYIFHLDFFGGEATALWWKPSTTECLAALPSLVVFARRVGNSEELIELVQQVCDQLDEERQQQKQGDAQYTQEENSFERREVSALRYRIYELLDASQRKL